MNLIFRVIYAAHCRSTHHKLALDALRHLEGVYRQRWQRLFLKHHEVYLAGAKDPDTKFKDFRNHVLHVDQHYWGGACKAARKWCDRMVASLERHDWSDVVYAAGVLSHYYTDPIQPFHTGQSQAETNIHRAAEWSITKSYDELREIAQHRDYLPKVEVPSGADWLEQMVAAGADFSHPHYQALIDHYDFASGRKDPPSGLDDYSRDVLAKLLSYAAVGLARVLDRAFDEADVCPPRTDLTIATTLATVKVPIRWVTKRMDDVQERALVEAMYDELQQSGRVEENLPEDDRTVRDLAAVECSTETPEAPSRRETVARPSVGNSPVESKSEVQTPDRSKSDVRASSERRQSQPESTRKIDVTRTSAGAESPKIRSARHKPHFRPPAPPVESSDDFVDPPKTPPVSAASPSPESTTHIAPDVESHREKSLRFYLETGDHVVDAPSIGPKTAKRLARIGVKTVADLFALSPETAAAQLGARHITADTIRDWQDQAQLVCRIPQLRGHDAQILVACGYRDPQVVANATSGDLLGLATEFANTSAGERVIRSGKAPDREEVSDWIEWAGQSRSLRAA